MEVIRSIEQIRGRKKIIFESGFVLWVRKGSNLPFSPDIGSEVEETDLERFILADQYPSALERAVSMLAERARSQKEIEQRLSNSFYDKNVIDLVLCKLEKEKLLNDRDFSEQWVLSRMKKYGAARISRELLQKGINRETIEDALRICTAEDQLETATKLAMKKIMSSKKETDRNKNLRRVTDMLLRRGYSWETAKKAFEAAEKTEDA